MYNNLFCTCACTVQYIQYIISFVMMNLLNCDYKSNTLVIPKNEKRLIELLGCFNPRKGKTNNSFNFPLGDKESEQVQVGTIKRYYKIIMSIVMGKNNYEKEK